jgi:signal peptidase I
MDKLTIIVVAIIVVAFAAGGATGYFLFSIVPPKNTMSMCYTRLQPSEFFDGKRATIVQGESSVTLFFFNATGRDIVISRVANTGSMRPAISDYSYLIEYVPKNEDEIHVGDIVVVKTKEDYMVHRIIGYKIENGTKYYRTKGDNNAVPDPHWVTFKDIKTKVVAIVY